MGERLGQGDRKQFEEDAQRSMGDLVDLLSNEIQTKLPSSKFVNESPWSWELNRFALTIDRISPAFHKVPDQFDWQYEVVVHSLIAVHPREIPIYEYRNPAHSLWYCRAKATADAFQWHEIAFRDIYNIRPGPLALPPEAAAYSALSNLGGQYQIDHDCTSLNDKSEAEFIERWVDNLLHGHNK